MQQFHVQASPALKGEITPPGDKSISHRAIMLGALAEGSSEINNFLCGADNLATLAAIQRLGIIAELDETKKQVHIYGQGLRGLRASSHPLDMGNSGTAMRLFMGLLAGQSFDSELMGDVSLSQRPMARVADPLKKMGATISLTGEGCAPIHIYGGKNLQGIEYTLPMASAQVKSALLFAGLYAQGDTILVEPTVTRDHTERMLRAFSYPIKTKGACTHLTGGHVLHATTMQIPGDISSAAFFMVAASIVPGSDIVLRNVGINPTRTGIIDLLQTMGGNIHLFNKKMVGNEPVADIAVKAAKLRGIALPPEQVPLAIDEMPILMIAAACAEGVTRLSGAKELRVKETDRIAAMAAGLTTLGINCTPTADGIVIQGGKLQGGCVHSFSDHRIAMAFAIAGCVAKGEVVIGDCENVQTSLPNFVELARSLGVNIEMRNSSVA